MQGSKCELFIIIIVTNTTKGVQHADMMRWRSIFRASLQIRADDERPNASAFHKPGIIIK